MVDDFKLISLLHMDPQYFNSRIWPHMFYTSEKDLWRWKMNVARAMGNTLDDQFIPSWPGPFRKTRTNGFWNDRLALGRIGGHKLTDIIQCPSTSEGLVKEEYWRPWGNAKLEKTVGVNLKTCSRNYGKIGLEVL